MDGAAIVARRLACLGDRRGLGENDRSATGYIARRNSGRSSTRSSPTRPESIRGWERAIDAQSRIVELSPVAEATGPPATSSSCPMAASAAC